MASSSMSLLDAARSLPPGLVVRRIEVAVQSVVLTNYASETCSSAQESAVSFMDTSMMHAALLLLTMRLLRYAG